MQALIVGPLAIPDEWKKFSENNQMDDCFIVAVDGGLDRCAELGLEPEFAVGDWDSLEDQSLKKKVNRLSLPRDKDRSDLSYALEFVANRSAKKVNVVGFAGGRMDHQLAVMQELSRFSDELALTFWTEKERIEFLSEKHRSWSGKLPIETVVSLFPLSDRCDGVTLEGFKYPLDQATLKPGSYGLSNEVTDSEVRISLRTGRLIVILNT